VKILRIIARLNVGGPAQQVALLSEALARQGCDTLLVHGVVADGEADAEPAVRRRHVKTLRMATLQRRLSPIADMQSCWGLLRIMRAFQPDVIHTHTAKAGTLGRLAGLIYNTTRPSAKRAVVVHTFHGHVLSGYFGWLGSTLARWAERSLALGSDVVLTLSARQRHDIVERFRVAAHHKVRVVPPAVDVTPLLQVPPPNAAARRAWVDEPDALVIGYVGRFAPIKGLETLVRAFGLVTKELPEARLLLVGGGSERESLHQLTVALGLQNRVVFAGWVEELATIYEAFDIVALTSISEGTPLAIIEAMAAGRPVVATAVGGVPDVVQDGKTGILVPAGDAGAVAGAILRLGADATARAAMGAAGREIAREAFDLSRTSKDVMQMYVTALAAKRGA
jgi:glycosyltransferase involved in cell wall biosynthesis